MYLPLETLDDVSLADTMMMVLREATLTPADFVELEDRLFEARLVSEHPLGQAALDLAMATLDLVRSRASR